MNNKVKYCSIFLIFTALLLLSTSMVSASDIDDNANFEISDNTITNTASDNNHIISQAVDDNNKDTQTIEKEVETTHDTNTTTTSKELNKEDKNLKQLNEAEITITPNPAKIGDNITITMDTSVMTSFYAPGDYDYIITLDGNDFLTGTVPKPGNGISGSFTIIVPEYQPGRYDMHITITNAKRPKLGAEGSATFTIDSSITETVIEEIDAISEE